MPPFDEFLRLTYGDDHWQTSTRVVYSSSPNEYSYRNHDKKENIYDVAFSVAQPDGSFAVVSAESKAEGSALAAPFTGWMR